MTEIYAEIAKLSDKFRSMAYGLTTDENKIHEAVQELMLYLLQANPDTIKKIYDNDGIEGITRYGAVALRRALTSTRSNFYYKYEKYYTHIDSSCFNTNYTSKFSDANDNLGYSIANNKNIANIPNEKVDNYQWTKLEEIDKALEGFTWYDKKIFELYYYEGNTLDSLAEKTSISRNSLFTTIDKVRTILKKKLNE
jgi:DNA-directed RNA polymerase specialized sigma24 family protein